MMMMLILTIFNERGQITRVGLQTQFQHRLRFASALVSYDRI